jgi:hypothetical protein
VERGRTLGLGTNLGVIVLVCAGAASTHFDDVSNVPVDRKSS